MNSADECECSSGRCLYSSNKKSRLWKKRNKKLLGHEKSQETWSFDFNGLDIMN